VPADVELRVPAPLEQIAVAVLADELHRTDEVAVALPELAQRVLVGVLRHGLGEVNRPGFVGGPTLERMEP
jgi:hypothetical protein